VVSGGTANGQTSLVLAVQSTRADSSSTRKESVGERRMTWRLRIFDKLIEHTTDEVITIIIIIVIIVIIIIVII